MYHSGGGFDGWIERVHPADRERFAREVGAFLESNAREAQLEYRFRRAAGDYVPVRDRVVVERGSDGTPIRLVAMVEERVAEAPPEPWTRYRDLFERIRDAVFVVDSRGGLEDFNPAFLELLGLSPDEARQRSIAGFYRDPAVGERLVADLRRSGTVSDREIRLVASDGRDVVVLISAVASFGEDGRYLGHQGILHDITARSRDEEEERLRAERLEDRLGALRTLYAISERLARAERLDGETLADVVDMIPSGLRFPALARASIALRNEEVAAEGFDAEGALSSPVTDPWGDGPTGSVSVSYQPSPLVEGPSPFLQEEADFLADVAAGLTETARRVHAVEARRRDGAYHRMLVERSHDLLAILDADGTIRYASPAAARLLGCEQNRLVGMNALEMIHSDDRAVAAGALAEAVEDPEAAPTVEHRIRHADGSWRYFESTGRSFLADPDIRGIVVNSRDVTDRRTLEAHLQHSQKMEVVGRLASGIAHEFNDLLTVIRVSTRILEDHFPEGRRPEEIDEITDAAAGAAALTRRLLAFSGREILDPRPVDLTQLIEDLEPFLRRELGEGVELDVRLPGRPVRILADPGQIEQVILNLCDNAWDAMSGNGRVTVEARTARADEMPPQILRPGDWALLRVSDTGPGIPDGIRDRIFEPFFTTKPNGTGLGMPTIRGIVSRLGGFVEVVSEHGDGARFTICFPRSEGHEDDRGGAPEPTSGFPTGRTILLVEGDPATRSVVELGLSEHGYRVLEAEDGIAALTLLEAYGGPLDLLLSAREMVPVDGEALAVRVLTKHPDAAVLFLGGPEGSQSGWPSLGRDSLAEEVVGAVEELLGEDGRGADGEVPEP